MGEITALVLAAGMGVRMGARGRLMPKGLIEIGNVPMIEQSVATLWAHGVARIVIVTGHLSEQYDRLFAGDDVELVYNPDYSTTGSLRTLAVGLAGIDTACLIVESDLIYSPRALAPMDCRTDRFLLSGPTGAGDEQYVWADARVGGGHTLAHISKDRRARDTAPLGEMVGFTALTAETVPLMRRVTDRVLAVDPAAHYEPGLVALARQIDVDCALISDLHWAEVDDEDMLERAANVVYPRVLAERELV